MNRLRNRLTAAFLVATVIPLIATLWLTTSLLERSLSFATTEELDNLSKSLERTAREYYQQTKENLREDALAGRVPAQTYGSSGRARSPNVSIFREQKAITWITSSEIAAECVSTRAISAAFKWKNSPMSSVGRGFLSRSPKNATCGAA